MAARDLMPDRFFVTEQLGDKQHMTPEGFLVIEDTPIARTGIQEYLPRELPLNRYDFAPAPDGIYYVDRPESEVFHTDAMRSANGKAVVNDHPWEDVTADNWRSLSIGDVYNPRRLGSVLIADIVIKDRAGIELVRAGKRELSCGYDVDYYEVSPGQLVQRNIRINHVALVERGRCGSACAIADHEPTDLSHRSTSSQQEGRMATGKTTHRLSMKDRLLASIGKVFDEAGEGVEKNMGAGDGEGEGGGPFKVENHIYAGAPTDKRAGDAESEVEKRVEKLEKDVKGIGDNVQSMKDSFDNFLKGNDRRDAETPEEKEKREKKEGEDRARDAVTVDAQLLANLRAEAPSLTGDTAVSALLDSAFLSPSYRDTVAGAEVLVPGIQVPGFDEKAKPQATFDSICGLRRNAMDQAYRAGADVRHLIDAMLGGGRTFDHKAMSCAETRMLFRAVVGAKRTANDARLRINGGIDNYNGKGPGEGEADKPIKTLHDLQAMFDKAYAPKSVN